ncbi:hypothetical protein Plhal710r2_c009g0042951 [Plasmopara halstedii]
MFLLDLLIYQSQKFCKPIYFLFALFRYLRWKPRFQSLEHLIFPFRFTRKKISCSFKSFFTLEDLYLRDILKADHSPDILLGVSATNEYCSCNQ